MTTTTGNWLKDATNDLKTADIESARLDALLLLEDVLQKSREWILAHDEQTLPGLYLENLNKMLARRLKREPLAYIIGSKEFYGHNFIINKDVLIPRPESEAMIELLKRYTRNDIRETIYDIGTGSGILAITAKLEFPNTTVIATDISEKALGVARRNAQRLGAHISFEHADLLSTTNDQRPTILLANLPYVPDKMITSPEIMKEPAEALFSGQDGLDHYRRLWNQVGNLTQKPSSIITESLEEQHTQMAKLVKQSGYKLEATNTLAQLFTLR